MLKAQAEQLPARLGTRDSAQHGGVTRWDRAIPLFAILCSLLATKPLQAKRDAFGVGLDLGAYFPATVD